MSWIGLVAELTDVPEERQKRRDDKRSEKRWRLRFEAGLSGERGPATVVVLDLSRAGFLIHTTQALAVDDQFTVDLPEAGPVEASIVWKRLTLHGCKFAVPVSRAVISATLLKAEPVRSPDRDGQALS